MSNPVIDSEGNKKWYNSDGQLHRTDGPAFEYVDGNKFWYINGEIHRLDGPAAEYVSGTKIWIKNGQKHREDGPAVEWGDGNKEYWLNGILHREDGPAFEYVDGYKVWWLNGQRHRLDGHAMEREDGRKSWWIYGNCYSEDKFNEIVRFPTLKVPYIVFNNSIYHIKFKEDVGIRLSYLLELYIDGVYIRHDNWIKQIILQFVKKSKQVEPMLDWIQENSNYFPNEFIERLFY